MIPTATHEDLPVQESMQHKLDVLDWQGLSNNRCELEFRPPLHITATDRLRVFAGAILVSLAAPVVAWGMSRWLPHYLFNWWSASATVVLGGILVSYRQMNSSRRPDGASGDLLTKVNLSLLLGPLFLWSAGAMSGWLNEPLGAYLYLVLLAGLMIILVADSVVTHTVFWLTATPTIDCMTARAWREDWGRRFVHGPAMRLPDEYADDPEAQRLFAAVVCARRDYVLGTLWLLLSMVLPVILIALITRRPNPNTVGLMIVIGVIQFLLLAAYIRNDASLLNISRSWRSITHWLHYGSGDPMPPWVFSSPCGPRRRRLLLAAIGCALVSIAVTYLLCGSLLRIVQAPSSAAIQQTTDTATPTTVTTTVTNHSKFTTHFAFLTWLVLIGASVGGCLLSPMIMILAVLTWGGSTLSSYTDALTYSEN